jgi:cellulose synthase/poly-beta-1,6-N-acetylglucosamine synthase-like glycosyltransferase
MTATSSASGSAAVGGATGSVTATGATVTLVGVPELLADAGRCIRSVPEHEAAGSLAVIEVRVPGGTGPEPIETVFDLVAATAARLAAQIAFDDDQGHYVLLLPLARTALAAVELTALLRRLAAVEMGGSGRSIRPSAGAGVVTLSGHVDPEDGLGEIDVALTEAIGLAHQSSVERALRVHSGHARPVDAGSSRVPARGPRGGSGVGAERRGTTRARLRGRYLSLSSRRKVWVLAVANMVMAWVVPFAVYSALYLVFGVDVSTVGFWVVLVTVVITALTVYAEAVLSLRPVPAPAEELASYPDASAIVVAFLPNETGTIVDTVRCLLAQDYPGSLEVVLAYNTPRRLPIEDDLAAIAAGDSRLILLRVGDSTSKAQNINAALQVVRGDVIGIFDSDHRPMPTAFRRAAAWLASGVDVVQGRSVVRNGDSNWLARMVAVEFEGIYAVAHPGRAALHRFGIFGGSNGFWRAELLDQLRMHPDMLTEDIDISIRAVFDGYRIAVDSQLISEELAPLTAMALWSQRIRWSHGWHQVSRRQVGRIWRTPALTWRQRLGASFLLGWREAYPWVAAQMVPILAFELLVRQHLHVQWLAPIFLVTLLYVSAVGPIQAVFAWRLAVPELRRRHWWWWQYVLVTGVVFGEFKALVSRAAHLRELLGDRAWQVTPRTAAPSGGSVARLHADATASVLIAMGTAPGTVTSREIDLPLSWPDPGGASDG